MSDPSEHEFQATTRGIFRSDVLPLASLFMGLVLGTIAFDGILHLFGLAWIGRYAGIPGVLIILLALGYSLRKRKLISWGAPRHWLRNHEWLTWIGSLLILVHGGVHFHAVLPWFALIAMLIVVASGLTGKYLLARCRRSLAEKKQNAGANAAAASFWDEIAMDAMRRWRSLHIPIAIGFSVLALGHILSILMFWGWH